MTQRYTYDVVDEPAGIVFRELFIWALRVATQLGLVIHSSGVKLFPVAIEFLKEMDEYRIETKEVSEWPGTRLIGKSRGTLMIYHLTPESVRMLVATADRLYAWINPVLPEDLHLLREDGSVVLGTITQERDAWMELNDNELATLVHEVPWMAKVLRQRT